MFDRRSLLRLLLAVPTTLLLITLLYWLGMHQLEQDPRTLSESLQWAAETMTTTGYGVDGRWRHPLMVAFVIVAQFAGVALVFLVLPVILIPMLESRFQTRLPRTTKRRDLLLIYRPGAALSTFLEELKQRDQPTLAVETTREGCSELLDDQVDAVHVYDPEDLFQAVGLDQIDRMVLAGPDHENATLLVEARQRDWPGEAIALADNSGHALALEAAGASLALTPKHVLGGALADRLGARLSAGSDGHQIPVDGCTGAWSEALRFVDVRVEAGSEAAGRTLEQLQVGSRTGCSVIGQWFGGRFEAPASAETMIAAGAVLTAIGPPQSIGRFEELCADPATRERDGSVLVFGHGEVGRRVAESLRAHGDRVRTCDIDPAAGAELTGDALDPGILLAEIEDLRAIVLALDSDARALLATLSLRRLRPSTLLVVGLREHSNASRLRKAGADSVLSLSQVASDLLLERLLDERRVWLSDHLLITRLQANVESQSLAQLALRHRTGATLLGLLHDDQVDMDVRGETMIHPGDELVLCGDRTALAAATDLLTS